MKLGKLVLLTVLFGMMLGSCQANPTPNPDNIETWELYPFYGELRFLIVREDTGTPIPGAILQVSNLSIVELRDEESISSGQDGRIAIHQVRRVITYRGEGPPRPTFAFSALHYRTQTHSVEDLVSGTSYDPYPATTCPPPHSRMKQKTHRSNYQCTNSPFVLYQVIDLSLTGRPVEVNPG